MVRNIGKFIAIKVLSLIFGVGAALAAPGDIDPSFGDGGKLTYSGQAVPLPDGRIALAQRVTAGFEVRMLDANGNPDTSYGDNGVALAPLADSADWFDAQGAVAAPDGTLAFRGGIAQTVNDTTTSIPAILKLDATGHPDATFGADGNGIVKLVDRPVEIGFLSGLALQGDGALLAAGTDGGFDYCSDSGAVVRLRPDGSVDTTFGTNGWVTIAEIGGTCLLRPLGQRADASIVVSNGLWSLWAFATDGAPVTAFGTDGQLSVTLPGVIGNVLLPDGGLLLVAQGDGESATRLVRYDATGQLDAGFGTGGTLDIGLGGPALGRGNTAEFPVQLLVAPDGQSLQLHVNASTRDGPYRSCAIVARLHLDGTLITDFGNGGATCLPGLWNVGLSVQGTGQPLLSDYNGTTKMFRLLLDDQPSPGIIGLIPDTTFADESAGTATVTVARSGGKNGAVSIDYATVAGTASAGSDFTSASGRLEWADGEDGDRTITITIADDTDSEGTSLPNTPEEEFGVDLTLAAGDSLLVATSPARVVIQDNDPRPTPTPTPQTSSGGGGSTSWFALVLLALAACRRRHTTVATHVVSVT